jgi:hypothetical protein
VAVAATVAAGCGSSTPRRSSGGPGGPTVGHAGDAAVLSTAYSRAVAARSARMNLNVSVTLPSKQTTLTGSGAYDRDGGSAS